MAAAVASGWAPAPSSISPSSGPGAGGQPGVVITGTSMGSLTGVTIGGAAATITANDATTVTVTTPAGSAGAAQDVVCTNASGSATLSGAYTYTNQIVFHSDW